MSWNIKTPGDYINGPLTVAGATTVTGNLTVLSTGLIVNTSGVGVGITPTSFGAGYGTIQVSGATGAGIRMGSPTNGSFIYSDASFFNFVTETNVPYRFQVNNQIQHTIAQLGVFTWFDGAGGTRMTLNSTGLGIGAVPSSWGSNSKVLQFGGGGAAVSSTGAGSTASRFTHGCYFDNTNWKYESTSVGASLYEVTGANGGSTHAWYISPGGTAGNTVTAFTAAAMTLDASGNLLVGDTSSPIASRVSLFTTFAQPDGIVIRNTGATAGLYWRFGAVNNSNTLFVMNASSVGVTMADGASAWSAVSDERFKDIIEPISNAVSKVGSLRSVIGKYKSDSEGTRRSFLIAQDVKSVLPEAVDSTDSESLGLRYTEVIPLLVAAIKELTARVQTLEAK